MLVFIRKYSSIFCREGRITNIMPDHRFQFFNLKMYNISPFDKQMSDSAGLFKYDAGYYEYTPGLWMCGKFTTDDAWATFNRKAVDAAVKAELRDTDVLVATYPKTGK